MKEKCKKTTKEKQTKTERSKGNRCYSDRVRARCFCCVFKLGFLQYICKASLILSQKFRNLRNFAKGFVKKILTLSWFLIHSKSKIDFHDWKSFLLYKFTCASCSSSYIGETFRHCKTRIEEHIKKDNKSHIFKHLHSSETCFDSYNSLCFKIIDNASSKFDVKIKEALHVNIFTYHYWRKPNLNAQQNHLALTLSLQLLFPLLLSVFVCFSFVAFCISLSSIVFIISTLIIGTFYCLNYTLLLLHLFITHLVIGFTITM